MKFDSAIARLQIALDNAKTNEPIQRKEGRVAEADLNVERIVSYQEAIKLLQWSQTESAAKSTKPNKELL